MAKKKTTLSLKSLDGAKERMPVAEVTPIPEHDPKYNISKTDLDAANERMKNIGAAAEKIREASVQGKSDVEIKGDKILHKRTSAMYDRIWNAFLETQSKDFEHHMGYTVKTIKRIGFKKFIDAMDWKDETDIGRWRTNKLHIVPCCHCKREFAVYENLALCDKCTPLYEIDKFSQVVNAVEAEAPGSAWMQRQLFTTDPNLRAMYLKEKIISKGRALGYSTMEPLPQNVVPLAKKQ